MDEASIKWIAHWVFVLERPFSNFLASQHLGHPIIFLVILPLDVEPGKHPETFNFKPCLFICFHQGYECHLSRCMWLNGATSHLKYLTALYAPNYKLSNHAIENFEKVSKMCLLTLFGPPHFPSLWFWIHQDLEDGRVYILCVDKIQTITKKKGKQIPTPHNKVIAVGCVT